ncbi:MAG: T9SS C-terminal target domain-containing protein [Sphingobacteriales bacterium]|nr:MAG: T9SS C-terminal target domain-containing protein [Sphingobacteriales bacterium]
MIKQISRFDLLKISTDNCNFQFNPQENKNIHIQLTDALGRIVLNQNLLQMEGMNNYLLEGNNLSSGSYFLTTTFNDTNKTETFKLIKTNF